MGWLAFWPSAPWQLLQPLASYRAAPLSVPEEDELLDELELEELELEVLEPEELELEEFELLVEPSVPGLLGAEPPPQASRLRLNNSVRSPGNRAWQLERVGRGVLG